MKFGISIFTTLVIIIGAVLFIQYQVHSNQVDLEEKAYRYSQEIEVVYRAESLDIRHHFKNLPDQKVQINLPANATAIECFLEAEYSCDRLNIENMEFTEGQTRTQSISYVIPIPGGLGNSTLLENVFAQLENGNAHFSVVHISTDSATKGQWVTGLPLIGQQELTLVNYTMFSGEGNVKDLYWDARDLAVQSIHPSITLYSAQPVSLDLKEQLSEINLLDDTHISIVQSNIENAKHRVLFMPEITVEAVQKQLLMTQLQSYYVLDESLSNDLKQMLLYYLTGASISSSKGNEMTAKLQSLMSENQLTYWKQLLIEHQGQEMNAEKMDELLGQVLNKATNYFEKNNEVTTVYPFYFIDGREIFYNSELQSDFEIIFYEGRVLYKAQPLLTALGYNAYEGENGYYVNNDTRIFRFPIEHGFYVYNQRRYNTASEPIEKIENQYFIEESWLQRLFLVEITKEDTSINIKPMSILTE